MGLGFVQLTLLQRCTLSLQPRRWEPKGGGKASVFLPRRSKGSALTATTAVGRANAQTPGCRRSLGLDVTVLGFSTFKWTLSKGQRGRLNGERARLRRPNHDLG